MVIQCSVNAPVIYTHLVKRLILFFLQMQMVLLIFLQPHLSMRKTCMLVVLLGKKNKLLSSIVSSTISNVTHLCKVTVITCISNKYNNEHHPKSCRPQYL